jgi:hypothetical protein
LPSCSEYSQFIDEIKKLKDEVNRHVYFSNCSKTKEISDAREENDKENSIVRAEHCQVVLKNEEEIQRLKDVVERYFRILNISQTKQLADVSEENARFQQDRIKSDGGEKHIVECVKNQLGQIQIRAAYSMLKL